jgi:phosphinothricin acetyltransferase
MRQRLVDGLTNAAGTQDTYQPERAHEGDNQRDRSGYEEPQHRRNLFGVSPTRGFGEDLGVGAVTIRAVSLADASAIGAIYAQVVEDTHISFEIDPPSSEEIATRISSVTAAFPWLVATDDGDVVGYAYAGPHGERAAYRWSVDTSIYLAAGARGRGVGTTLYRELLSELTALGYVSAFAGIALPNDASVALHQRAGFASVGSFPLAGFKLGRWWDVALLRRALNEPTATPEPPARWDPAH